MEIKVFYPDGRAEVLLNVPGYDFSWQTRYSFRQPVAIPKGTRFMVTGYLDNSAENKNNPDPTRAVRFGEPTYDEMMVSIIEYTIDGQELNPTPVALRSGLIRFSFGFNFSPDILDGWPSPEEFTY